METLSGETLRIIRPACRGGAGRYVADGWANAAEAMGWLFLMWDGRDTERVFDEFAPHIYIADVRYRHRVPSRVRSGATKVAMTVDQWADEPAFPSLARQGYRTTRSHVRWVRKLDPQILYHHASPKGIEIGWRKWAESEHRRVISVPLAGDTETYFPEGTIPELRCDLGFLGGYAPYKAPGLHEYLLDFAGQFRTLIFGPGWPTGTSVRPELPDAQRNAFFQSATVMPCIHEPHARLYGVEVTERLFKVPLAGGFTISDPIDCIHGEGLFSEDELLVARSGREMRDLVRYFHRHPDEREPFIQRSRARILREHTYFHRLAQLLGELGFPAQAARLRTHVTRLAAPATSDTAEPS